MSTPLDDDDPRPQYLVAAIRERLAHDELLAALDLGVRVVDRDVFVTGTVTTDARLEALTALLAECLPAHVVHLHVTVLHPHSPSSAEEIR